MRSGSIAVYVRTWLALLVLLALTCASSFVPLGHFNTALNIVIASAKAVLVALVFMHLAKARATVLIVAIAGIAWLSLLVVLSLGDFLLRRP